MLPRALCRQKKFIEPYSIASKMPKQKTNTPTRKSIASDAAARAERDKERHARNAAATAAAAASASSPASSSPAAASPAAASPGAGVDIGSIEDEDGNLLSVLLPHEKKSRAEIKAISFARAATAREAKAAKRERAEAALPAPGTRRSPACCSRFPLLTLI